MFFSHCCQKLKFSRNSLKDSIHFTMNSKFLFFLPNHSQKRPEFRMGSPDLGDDFHSDYESGSPRSQTGDASFFRKYGIDLERRLVFLLSNMNIWFLL